MNDTTKNKSKEHPSTQIGYFEVKNHLLVRTDKRFSESVDLSVLEKEDQSLIEYKNGHKKIFTTINDLRNAVRQAEDGCIVMFIFKERNPKCNHFYSIDKTRLIPITNQNEVDFILSATLDATRKAFNKIKHSRKFIFFNLTNIIAFEVDFDNKKNYVEALKHNYEYVVRLDPCTMDDLCETLGTLYAKDVKPKASNKHVMTTEESRLIDTMIDMLNKLKNMHVSIPNPHKAEKKRQRNARRKEKRKASKDASGHTEPKKLPNKEKTDCLFSKSYY